MLRRFRQFLFWVDARWDSRLWRSVRRGHAAAVLASQQQTQAGDAHEEAGVAYLLWPEGAPGAMPDVVPPPALTPYLPPPNIANGAAVVICPGGGYAMLAEHEGEPVARWLNTLGVAAFVLQYRLGPQSRHPAMLDDAARAVRMVRAKAGDWNVDPGRVGILGFSAGGHLASTLATHFDGGMTDAADPVERASSRPDLAILIYPVVTMQEPYGHAFSRSQLLGDAPDEELVALLSNDLQVTPQTPPMFLVHSANDLGVPCEHSLLMASALSRAGVPFELHIYERGDHGFGMGEGDAVLSTWPDRCAEWLRGRGFLDRGRG